MSEAAGPSIALLLSFFVLRSSSLWPGRQATWQAKTPTSIFEGGSSAILGCDLREEYATCITYDLLQPSIAACMCLHLYDDKGAPQLAEDFGDVERCWQLI